MVYKGHVKNGVVIFDEPAPIADGTAVQVEPVVPKTLADRFRDVIGSAPELPKDMAESHDHYIHGTPKD